MWRRSVARGEPSTRTIVSGDLADAPAHPSGMALAFGATERQRRYAEAPVGRILIGVVIGIVLMIWLLVSCAQAIF